MYYGPQEYDLELAVTGNSDPSVVWVRSLSCLKLPSSAALTLIALRKLGEGPQGSEYREASFRQRAVT